MQKVALESNLTENGLLVRIASGTALAMRVGVSCDVMEVHRMLAHPSEDITRKTAEMMGIKTTGQWGACETCFQAKAKRHAVPKKTECFNDWGGWGYDDFVSGEVIKTTPSGDRIT